MMVSAPWLPLDVGVRPADDGVVPARAAQHAADIGPGDGVALGPAGDVRHGRGRLQHVSGVGACRRLRRRGRVAGVDRQVERRGLGGDVAGPVDRDEHQGMVAGRERARGQGHVAGEAEGGVAHDLAVLQQFDVAAEDRRPEIERMARRTGRRRRQAGLGDMKHRRRVMGMAAVRHRDRRRAGVVHHRGDDRGCGRRRRQADRDVARIANLRAVRPGQRRLQLIPSLQQASGCDVDIALGHIARGQGHGMSQRRLDLAERKCLASRGHVVQADVHDRRWIVSVRTVSDVPRLRGDIVGNRNRQIRKSRCGHFYIPNSHRGRRQNADALTPSHNQRKTLSFRSSSAVKKQPRLSHDGREPRANPRVKP